jgi:hypothetical protein
MMIAIHQPHFLPWLGYLHRMAQVDLFVLLDHVQFERRNYQNRTQFRLDDQARWLTIPVVQRSQKERIVEKLVDHSAPSQFATLRHAYRDAGFFGTYAPEVKRLLDTKWERLVDINQASLDLLRDAFGITTPLARTSELAVEGARGDLILNICKAVGATQYMVGFGGSRGYLDADAFAAAGVEIVLHEFTHPEYKQCGKGPFIKGLSAIDMLFNVGPALPQRKAA